MRVANIGPRGVRQRALQGSLALVVGLAAGAALAATRAWPGFALLLWVPFWGAALALVQARDRT